MPELPEMGNEVLESSPIVSDQETKMGLFCTIATLTNHVWQSFTGKVHITLPPNRTQNFCWDCSPERLLRDLTDFVIELLHRTSSDILPYVIINARERMSIRAL